MTQEKSAAQCSYGERVKRLRLELDIEWKDLAERLEVSPSMLFQVVRGDKKLSDRTLFRLRRLEEESGIATTPKEGLVVREDSPEYGGESWKNRALVAEKELQELKATLRKLSE